LRHSLEDIGGYLRTRFGKGANDIGSDADLGVELNLMATILTT
jgi:hypothetical protein